MVREPKVEIVLPKEYKKLKFNIDNEVKFKVIAKDNLPFNLSTTNNRKPTLDLSKTIWTGLAKSQTTELNPEIKIVSEQVDPNDPRNYVFDLTTNIQPKSLNKIELEIPAIFPRDIFNPEGIIISKKITLKVNATFDAEIVSPPNGSIIKDIVKVTSKVTKPKELEGNLSLFTNCKGSVIYYGIRPHNTTEIKTFRFVSKKGEKQIPKSKGKEQVDVLTFEDKLNLNLKTSNEYEKSFLDGSIFGPIELYGEYSTLCNPENIDFTGEPKTYVLLDHPEILQGKCFYPNGSSSSKCHFTASNNTILNEIKALQLEIIPDKGIIDPSCKIPLVTFKNKNDLTKKIEINCLPKEATSFEIKLKRNPSFLAEIEKRFSGTDLESTIITSNENAVIVDRKIYEVKNAPSEEVKTAFEIGDSEEESKTTSNGNTVSVRDLKDILISVGLLSESERGVGYTKATKDAWKLFIYLTKECDINSLKLQTTDPNQTFMLCANFEVIRDANGNIINLPDPNDLPEPLVENLDNIPVWKQILDGFTQSAANNIKDLINPATIGIISTVVLLTTTGLVASIAASVPAALLALATYSVITGGTLLNAKFIIDEINNNFINKSAAWKISYGIGRLQPDLTLVKGITGLVKNVKISEKVEKILGLDNGAQKETAEFIHEEQRVINKLDITEEARNMKKGQLDTYADSTYESLLTNDQTKKTQINNLYNEVNKDSNMRANLEGNVIYKDYPKDLNNTLEDPLVVKEKIFKPTIEYGAKAKAVGVENKFLFKNEFDKDFGSNFNLQDLQKQGFLLGDVVPAEKLPQKVWRVINYKDDLNMLGGGGSVLTFSDDSLTLEKVEEQLVNNREYFVKKLGLKPNDFQGKLILLEIDTQSSKLNFYKPTTKDGKFGGKDAFFRHNNSDDFGRTLDLNTGNDGFKELAVQDLSINKNELPDYIKLKEIN